MINFQAKTFTFLDLNGHQLYTVQTQQSKKNDLGSPRKIWKNTFKKDPLAKLLAKQPFWYSWSCNYTRIFYFYTKSIDMERFENNFMKLKQCTVVRFASFFSGGFITAIVVNPPERRLAKCTSVQWKKLLILFQKGFHTT